MPSPAAKNFPLRWESTGDQWWYASPIDYAAANGLYDLVSELLHLDANLLIKLTSLRRIRRLESLWDDHHDVTTDDVAKCRSRVARRLLHECQKGPENNSLIRAGYGGWLIYTAAAAGDVAFVNELLERDPLLVFGEGEYGVSDVLYGAARSGKAEVFRVVMEFSIGRGNVDGERRKEEFRWEMMNRAVHAAARGGNVEVLKELMIEERDVLGYRDAKGASVLHSASARGQVEVVKYLLASFDISTIVDSQGNTALHVAAYRGHSAVVEVLITASPSLASLSNHYGDTFLHMAVAGFRAPGFRRMDKQIELIKQLVCGDIVNVQDIINDRNNNGRTALHIAVSENIHSSVVEHLMSVPSIDLNIQDGDGMTPLDILKQRPKSPSSELLMKQLISAGGVSKCRDHKARRVIVSHLRMHGIGSSPGTSFPIPDAEIFLYTGIDNASDASGDQSCLQSGEISQLYSPKSISNKKIGSVNSTARRFKHFLQWPRRKEKKESNIDLGDADSLDSYRPSTDLEDSPIPLRELYSNTSSLPNNKRIHSLPSPYTKMKYTAGLTHGVIQTAPHFGFPAESNASPISQSAMSSPAFVDKKKGADNVGSPRSASAAHSRQSSFNAKLLHKYLCVGAQGVKAEEAVSSTWDTRSFKHSTSLVT